MITGFYNLKNSEAYDKAMAVGGVIATEVPKAVASGVVENYKMPPFRMANEGVNKQVAGEGTGKFTWNRNSSVLDNAVNNAAPAADWTVYAADRLNDVTNYTKWGKGIAAKADPKSLFGMGTSMVDSRFLKNRGTMANMTVGALAGTGIDLAGEAMYDNLTDRERFEQDLADAEFYGDDELKARIFNAMNTYHRAGDAVKTLAHGASTGSALGPKGMAVGTVAASGVVGLQAAMPATYHDFDPKFARENRARRREVAAKTVSGFSQNEEYGNIADSIIEEARRVVKGEISPDTFDADTAIQIIQNSKRPDASDQTVRQGMMLDKLLKSKLPETKRRSQKDVNSKYTPSDPFEHGAYYTF
jgi:hypothetical protein